MSVFHFHGSNPRFLVNNMPLSDVMLFVAFGRYAEDSAESYTKVVDVDFSLFRVEFE